VGNFEQQPPTEKQYHSLAGLVAKKMRQYELPLANVKGHGSFKGNDTVCPGKLFDMDRLYRLVEEQMPA
jgi:N-acetyl-anhydromuramyl-L-alanine amidase AmpD